MWRGSCGTHRPRYIDIVQLQQHRLRKAAIIAPCWKVAADYTHPEKIFTLAP